MPTTPCALLQNTNGTQWTGLVGALLNNQADVAVAALSITPEREEVIEFSVPFLETGITIVVAIREGAISPTAFLGKNVAPSPVPLLMIIITVLIKRKILSVETILSKQASKCTHTRARARTHARIHVRTHTRTHTNTHTRTHTHTYRDIHVLQE